MILPYYQSKDEGYARVEVDVSVKPEPEQGNRPGGENGGEASTSTTGEKGFHLLKALRTNGKPCPPLESCTISFTSSADSYGRAWGCVVGMWDAVHQHLASLQTSRAAPWGVDGQPIPRQLAIPIPAPAPAAPDVDDIIIIDDDEEANFWHCLPKVLQWNASS